MSGSYEENSNKGHSSWETPSSSQGWNYNQGQYSQYWRDYQQERMAYCSQIAGDRAPQNEEPNTRKRERSGSPGLDSRETARFRVTDITDGPVNPDGNRLHDDVTWIKQEDD